MKRAIGQSHTSDPLALSPATASVGLSKAGEFADAGPCIKCLDFGNFAQNLEVHHQSVSKSYGSGTVPGCAAMRVEQLSGRAVKRIRVLGIQWYTYRRIRGDDATQGGMNSKPYNNCGCPLPCDVEVH
jgi:hypothetical protein